MNFEQALEILKSWPPDEEAPLSPEQEQALQMLETDPELERALRQRDAFDQRVSWVMSDVPCSAGLKFRIHDALERSGVAPAMGSAEISRRSALRRAVGLTSAASVLLAVAMTLAVYFRQHEQLAFNVIKSEMPAVWRSRDLPEFPATEAPRLPHGGWLSAKVSFSGTVGRYSLKDGRPSEIAVRRFSIRNPRGGIVSGMLLAIPADAIRSEDRPDETDFFHGLKDSIVQGRTTLAMVSWSEGSVVYVCLIPSGPAESVLQDALRIDVS